MIEVPSCDSIIEILYGEKKILNSIYTKEQIDQEKALTQKLNKLMRREIYNSSYFESIQNLPHYKPIERAFTCILKCILERADCFKNIASLNYHLIVTGGLYLRSDSNGKDVFILLEWPLINFIDLLNTSVLCSKDFDEYYIDCKSILNAYRDKFFGKNEYNIFSSLYDKEQFQPTQYQLMQLFQQIQSIFIISHELGHILNPNDLGIEAEISADRIALKAVNAYTYNNSKMKVWTITAIMLLYSYLTLLGVEMAVNYEEKKKCRENWMVRYDMMLDQLQELSVSPNEQELIGGYDTLCMLMDKLCLEIIEKSI